jgi:CPA1 family monovalent cation:H+ antiporter
LEEAGHTVASPGPAATDPVSVIATFREVKVVLLGRAAAVYPLSALFRRTASSIDPRYQYVLVWDGTT